MIWSTLFMIFITASYAKQLIRGKEVLKSHHNITLLLDGLLNGYDKNLRPNFGGAPIVVEIDFNVRSMGPISEVDMTFSMDCYFRQTWIDKRLSFTGDIKTMTLGISTLEKIWKPDTYFFNGKQSYLHTITVPNRFVRIDQEGRVLYSQRLTVKASCPMNLENFPIDTQRCPLSLGSFGYSLQDVLYRWNSLRRVVIASDMKMSQFDLISTPSKNDTTIVRDGEYSTLAVNFYLQRHTGYFLIQVYAPCMLLVVLSWVAFWINREATADRVALGVTTILTMTFLGLDSRNDLPKVSYSTALDSFMAISFTFVFATIIQFALVHYFTKRGSGEVYLIPNDSSEDEFDENFTEEDDDKKLEICVDDPMDMAFSRDEFDQEVGGPAHIPSVLEPRTPIKKGSSLRGQKCPQCNRNMTKQSSQVSLNSKKSAIDIDYRNRPGENRNLDNGTGCPVCIVKCIGTVLQTLKIFRSPTTTLPKRSSNGTNIEETTCQNNSQQQVYQVQRNHSFLPLSASSVGKKRAKATTIDLEEFNSVSKIDSISRILFPASFLVINLFYWYIYLSQNALYSSEMP